MTNTTYLASVPTSAADGTVKRTGSLSTMKLAELQGLADTIEDERAHGLRPTGKLRA